MREGPERVEVWERRPGAAFLLVRRYRRREPERTFLHAVVREHLEPFLADETRVVRLFVLSSSSCNWPPLWKPQSTDAAVAKADEGWRTVSMDDLGALALARRDPEGFVE